jgi:hypothetical protein
MVPLPTWRLRLAESEGRLRSVWLPIESAQRTREMPPYLQLPITTDSAQARGGAENLGTKRRGQGPNEAVASRPNGKAPTARIVRVGLLFRKFLARDTHRPGIFRSTHHPNLPNHAGMRRASKLESHWAGEWPTCEPFEPNSRRHVSPAAGRGDFANRPARTSSLRTPANRLVVVTHSRIVVRSCPKSDFGSNSLRTDPKAIFVLCARKDGRQRHGDCLSALARSLSILTQWPVTATSGLAIWALG